MSDELQRWSEGGAQSEDEAKAAALFRGASAPPPLPPEAMRRIEAGLTQRLGTRRKMPSWLKAILGVGAIGAGSLAFAAVQAMRADSSSEVAPRAEAPAIEIVTSEPEVVTPPVEVQTPKAVVESVTPRPEAAPAPRPSTRRPVAAKPSTVAPEVPAARNTSGDLGREAAMLEEALAALRERRDAHGALQRLDEYRSEFPNGQLRTEISRTRIEALLTLQRHPEALAEVRALRKQVSGGAKAELWVVEGELLSSRDDCQGAVKAFDAALGASPARMHAERALAGRAHCRMTLGDARAAREDAAAYLRQYPQGRYADELRIISGQ